MADASRKNYFHNIPAARNLRRPMTPAEETLWERLRDRRLDGLKFRRQHAIGRFVVDFYCHERRLIVEVDGGIHLEPSQRQRDRQRQFELEERGLSFLRFTNEEVAISLDFVVARIANFSPSPVRHESGEGAGGWGPHRAHSRRRGLAFLRFTNEEVAIGLDFVVARITNFSPSLVRHESGEGAGG